MQEIRSTLYYQSLHNIKTYSHGRWNIVSVPLLTGWKEAKSLINEWNAARALIYGWNAGNNLYFHYP